MPAWAVMEPISAYGLSQKSSISRLWSETPQSVVSQLYRYVTDVPGPPDAGAGGPKCWARRRGSRSRQSYRDREGANERQHHNSSRSSHGAHSIPAFGFPRVTRQKWDQPVRTLIRLPTRWPTPNATPAATVANANWRSAERTRERPVKMATVQPTASTEIAPEDDREQGGVRSADEEPRKKWDHGTD